MKLQIENLGYGGTGGVRTASNPIGLNSIKITSEIEQDFYFFRKKFDGTLTFQGTDFDLIYGLEQYTCCNRIILYFYRDCDDLDSPYFIGYFFTNKCTYDLDNQTVTVSEIKPYDVFEFLFQNWEKKINIMDVIVDTNLNFLYERQFSDEEEPLLAEYFDRNRNFSDVICHLIRETLRDTPFFSMTPSKDLLGKVFTDDLSPINDQPNVLKNLAVCQASDFYDPASTSPAIKSIMTLKQVIEFLREFAQVGIYLSEETGLLAFEHISFFPQLFYKINKDSPNGNYYLPYSEDLTLEQNINIQVANTFYTSYTENTPTYEGFKEYLSTQPFWGEEWLTDYLEYVDTLNEDLPPPQRTIDMTSGYFDQFFYKKQKYDYDDSQSFARFDYENDGDNLIYEGYKSDKYSARYDFVWQSGLEGSYFFNPLIKNLEPFAKGNISFYSECTLRDKNGKGKTDPHATGPDIYTNIDWMVIKFKQLPFDLKVTNPITPNYDRENAIVLLQLSTGSVTETIERVWDRDAEDNPITSSRTLTYKTVVKGLVDMGNFQQNNGNLSMSTMTANFHIFEKPFSSGFINQAEGVVVAQRWMKSTSYNKRIDNIEIRYCCGYEVFDLKDNIKTFAFTKGNIRRAVYDAEKGVVTITIYGSSICNLIVSGGSLQNICLPQGILLGRYVRITDVPDETIFGQTVPTYKFECIGIYSDGICGFEEKIIPC